MSQTAIQKTEKKLDTLISRLVTGMMIGIAIFALFLLWGDVRGVVEVLFSISPFVFLLSVTSTFISYLIRFVKWNFMLKHVKIHLPLRESLSIFFIGLSMSITPGKVGEFLKSYLIKKYSNIEMARSASIVFVDRLTDLFAMLLLISIGISLFAVGYLPFIFFVILSVGVTMLLRRRFLSLRVIKKLTGLRFLEKYRESAITLYENVYSLLDTKALFLTTLISTLAWFMECASLYVLVSSLQIKLSFILDIFIFSFGTLAGALSMLPGGLGIAEGSITGLFIYFGLDKSTAVTITLLIRLVTLWLGVFLGIIVFLKQRKKYLI